MNIGALLITSLAGISTILGFFILWMKQDNNVIPSSLGFSAGVMTVVSLLDLLPSSIYYFQKSFVFGFHLIFCLLFFLVGILFSIMLNENIHQKIGEGSSLYKIGILSMIAIILHNIPEGIITYLTTNIELKAGIFLAFSIACHNIPEGICIAIPIYYATKKKSRAFFMVLLSALSEPIGALIAALFFKDSLSDMIIAIFLALVAGIMVSLSSIQILPESYKYSKKHTIQFFIIGILLMIFSHLFFT